MGLHGRYRDDSAIYKVVRDHSAIDNGDLRGVKCRSCKRRVVTYVTDSSEEVQSTDDKPVRVCGYRHMTLFGDGRGCKESVCHDCFVERSPVMNNRPKQKEIPTSGTNSTNISET